jgi:hypothetical protein
MQPLLSLTCVSAVQNVRQYDSQGDLLSKAIFASLKSFAGATSQAPSAQWNRLQALVEADHMLYLLTCPQNRHELRHTSAASVGQQ